MTITNKIAQIKLGRLRTAERNIRTGSEMYSGIRFRAANDESEIAPTKPRMVETNAIFNVSIIPR
jgi:hypothetical protein